MMIVIQEYPVIWDISDLQQSSLSHKHLVHVQQDVATLHDHPLYGQVLPDVLRLRDLVVHLAREVLQLDPGLLQGVLLHVVGRGVGQELVQGDDVPRDLVHGVGQEELEGPALALGLVLQPGDQTGELGVLFALRQHLDRELFSDLLGLR